MLEATDFSRVHALIREWTMMIEADRLKTREAVEHFRAVCRDQEHINEYTAESWARYEDRVKAMRDEIARATRLLANHLALQPSPPIFVFPLGGGDGHVA